MQRQVLVDPATLARTRATVLDASWVYPPLNRAGVDVRRRYAAAHIPGSVFLDLEALSPGRPKAVADVPAIAAPTPATLEGALRALDVVTAQPIVVTDQDGGTTTAPFARLALLDAGFEDVRLLDGGTPAWIAAGLPLTAADDRFLDVPSAGDGARRGRLVGTATTRRALVDGTATVVDARFVDHNAGVLPPRFRHVAIPAPTVLRPGDVVEETATGSRFRAPSGLRERVAASGLADAEAVIVTCHFGVGAAVVATALEIAGVEGVRVDVDSLLGWWAADQPPSG
jgi:thiosulfate/3-mercaptopyruvate sulfurtransferase